MVRAPPRGGKSAGCNTVGAFVEWFREPPLRPDGRVGCSVGFGLRPTAQSGRGGSGCCDEVVREDEDVDDLQFIWRWKKMGGMAKSCA